MSGLLSKGVHYISAQEFVRLTCFSLRRVTLYNHGLKELANFMIKNRIEQIYVDGSFLEDNPWPNDIDVVFEISVFEYIKIFGNKVAFKAWHHTVKNTLQIDCFPAISDIKDVELEGRVWKTSMEYWLWKFGRARDDSEKGIACLKTADILTENPI